METMNSTEKMAFYYLLGKAYKEINPEFDKVFTEAFNKEFSESGKNNEILAYRKAYISATKAALSTLPFRLRLNYFCNSFSKMMFNDIDEINNIDFNFVNSCLNENRSDIDKGLEKANCKSLDEFKEFANKCFCIMYDLDPYKTLKCKKCGNEFSIHYNEAYSFISKGLELPKTCYYCRKGLKNQAEAEKEFQKKLEEENKLREEFKTSAMADALKGIKLDN